MPASPWLGGKPPAAPTLHSGKVRDHVILSARSKDPIRLFVFRLKNTDGWQVHIRPAGKGEARVALGHKVERAVVTAVDRAGLESKEAVLER